VKIWDEKRSIWQADLAQTSETGRTNYDGVLDVIQTLPSYKGDYYYEKVGKNIPDVSYNYKKYPGMFCNIYVQNAKLSIDSYIYGGNVSTKALTQASTRQKIHMYHIAECKVEGVTAYVTDDWLKMMKMENKKYKFAPPCINESLPTLVQV